MKKTRADSPVLTSSEASVLSAFGASDIALVAELSITTLSTPDKVREILAGLQEKQLVEVTDGKGPELILLTKVGSRMRRALRRRWHWPRSAGVMIIPDEAKP